KLDAARLVTDAGEAMIVANGRDEHVLTRILAGEDVGTLFAPSPRKRSSRSRWIGAARPAGAIVIDDGAVKALVEKNRSLLAAGIVRVEGNFARGDIIEITAGDGQCIARGLSN